jgi:hypothetical protein
MRRLLPSSAAWITFWVKTFLRRHTGLAMVDAITADSHSDCSLPWISIKWIGMDTTNLSPAAPPIGPRCNSVFLLRGMCQSDSPRRASPRMTQMVPRR